MLTRFYIGTGFDKDGKPLSADFVLQCERDAIAHFSRIYGGCTVTNSRGGWVDGNGVLVIEQGLVFEVIGDQGKRYSNAGAFHAHYLKNLFKQSSIAYAVIDAATDFV